MALPLLLIGGAMLLSSAISVGGTMYMMHKQNQMQEKQLAAAERMEDKQIAAQKPFLEAMQKQSAEYQNYCKQFIGQGQDTLTMQRNMALGQQSWNQGGSGYPVLPGQSWTGSGGPPWVITGGTNTFTVGGAPPRT